MPFSEENKKMLKEHFTVNQLETMSFMVGNAHQSEPGKDYYINEIATRVDSLLDLKVKMNDALGPDDSSYDVSVFTGGNDEVVSKEDLDQTKMGLQKINDSQQPRSLSSFFLHQPKEGKSENLESLINSINQPVEKFTPPGQ